MLHCPLNAPLAVRPVSKSGSLSVARWILQIDAPKARDLSLMASTWRPFEADRELYFDWASRWVSNRRTGSDPREQDAKDMALRSRFGQESSGVILAASASSCLSLRGASFPLKLCIKTNIYIYISIHVIYYYSIIYLPSYYIYIYYILFVSFPSHFPRWQPRTCCRLGIGRLKVIFVRNPYKRLASAYLAFFLEPWPGCRFTNVAGNVSMQ